MSTKIYKNSNNNFEQHHLSEKSQPTKQNSSANKEIKVIYIYLNKLSNNKSRKKTNKSSRYNKTPVYRKTHLTRKIRSIKDSIKSKKFIPRKFKKFIIRGAVTLLAVSGLALFTHNFTNYVKNLNTKHETELDTYETSKLGDITIYEQKTNVNYEIESETTSETQITTQPEIQSETQSEAITEAKLQYQQKKTTKPQLQQKKETIPPTKNKTKNKNKKTIAQKIKQFKKEAVKKYMSSFIIGEHPKVGNLFEGQTFSANTDGSGSIGHFDKHKNYKMERVYVITDEDWYTENVQGENLPDILSNYPDLTGYCIHFTDAETGGNLGFVTDSQLEDIITNKVNSIVKNKKTKSSNQTNNAKNSKRNSEQNDER